MRIKTFLCAVLAMIGLMTSVEVKAQSTDATRWKGNEYSALATTTGTEVFLYNVGTGRFLIHGGDWGVQARFLYDDTGKLLTIKKGKAGSNIVFDTGMSTDGAAVLGARRAGTDDPYNMSRVFALVVAAALAVTVMITGKKKDEEEEG